MTWKVNREAAVLLGGGRALLMQLAHPAVAEGVDEHSDFRRRPLGRLLRTLDLTYRIAFGTRADALEAARAVNRAHRGVRGPGYSATDPDLLLWVHATLVDSALVSYQAFVGPLEVAERAAYYEESKLVGSLLGIPASSFPEGLAGFERYLAWMISDGPAQPGPKARELASLVLRPRFPTRALTAGLLPEVVRSRYGLGWGPVERALFAAARGFISRAVPLSPSLLRKVPAARAALRRAA